MGEHAFAKARGQRAQWLHRCAHMHRRSAFSRLCGEWELLEGAEGWHGKRGCEPSCQAAACLEAAAAATRFCSWQHRRLCQRSSTAGDPSSPTAPACCCPAPRCHGKSLLWLILWGQLPCAVPWSRDGCCLLSLHRGGSQEPTALNPYWHHCVPPHLLRGLFWGVCGPDPHGALLPLEQGEPPA